jgi:hypothetical protein
MGGTEAGAILSSMACRDEIEMLGLRDSENKLVRVKSQSFQKVDQDFASASIVPS